MLFDDIPFEAVPVGQEFHFEIFRGHIEPGKTFSQEAFQGLLDSMSTFVASQVAQRWQQTNEPPTTLTVHVRCDIG